MNNKNQQTPRYKKISTPLGILVIVLIIFVMGVWIYFQYFYKSIAEPEQLFYYKVFSTKEECEEKTGCQCNFVNCDDVPREKTYEEICGSNFKKGWQCIKSKQERDYFTQKPEESLIKEEKLTIDLSQCKKEDYYSYWAFGSVQVKVVGSQFSLCKLIYSTETEGGYIVYECNLPISLKRVVISETHKPGGGMYWIEISFDVSRFCKKIKTGDIFKDVGYI